MGSQPPVNDANLSYLPGSPERIALKAELTSQASTRLDIPLVIGGREVRSGDRAQAVMPHDHAHVLADWHAARPADVTDAIAAAAAVAPDWSRRPLRERAAIFRRAADLLASSWRPTLNAATMLGQSKTVFQAEIDAASELIDFWRFNPHFAEEIEAEQPISTTLARNALDYRPLEGFVYAVSPFNFTSIAGNLPTAPALMGNTVIWKPASSALPSAWYILELLREAGLPPGVINFVPGDAAMISQILIESPHLAGIHFTGSTSVFNGMWRAVGERVGSYRTYPRLVGETGGKDFIVAHASADIEALAVAIVRGGFEYQGQKCSAASRVYVPRSLWPAVRDRVIAMMGEVRLGDVQDFRTFMGAVIDGKAFDRISGYLAHARAHATILSGGKGDRSSGYFIEPTLVETTDPAYRLLCEEIFGPVVTAHAYPDAAWPGILDVIDRTSPYALTGSVFAQDPAAVAMASDRLRQAAGNFYVNDKPTGAVVGQQPFGGSRASGTNDKAGSKINLLRWTSARTIKETFQPPTSVAYEYMSEA